MKNLKITFEVIFILSSWIHHGLGFDIKSLPSSSTSRRKALSTISKSIITSSSTSSLIATTVATTVTTPLILSPQPSHAATPLTTQEADNFQSKLQRKLRKSPPKLLRQNLNLDFAVLLMRSSYNAVDELDFVPMDQFQKDFFLIRQAEHLPYVNELGPGLVSQGDLQDPYYFDFISFAQYATIFRDISIDPAVVFVEQQPVLINDVGTGGGEDRQEFVSKVIRRDTSILDNSVLAIKHSEIVGNTILNNLIEKFAGTASAIPLSMDILENSNNNISKSISSGSSRPNTKELLGAIQQLVNLFVISGFAFDGKVAVTKDFGSSGGAQFEITLTAPATLWSGQALAAKKANPVNDFVLKTAKALVSRAGYKVSSSTLVYTNSQEISTLFII